MKRNQAEGHPNETKDKTENPNGKSGAVLGEINDDAKRHGGKARGESEDTNDHPRKHGDKNGAVLGEINDDAKKENQ